MLLEKIKFYDSEKFCEFYGSLVAYILENLTAWSYSRTWYLTESRNKTPGAMQLAQSKGWGWPKHALNP